MRNHEVSGLISNFPSNKKEQQTFVEELIDDTLDGNCDILHREAQMCNIEQVIKAYRKNEEIKEAVLNAAEKHGAKTFDYAGANIQIKEVGIKYNFSELGHLRYNDICAQIDLLTEKKKELETILKAHSSVWVETDFDTGETYEVLPAVKTSTTQAVFTIKK